nr:5,10-methylenetetrahydrofolate reductase-like [Nerophis lumbriciformis]
MLKAGHPIFSFEFFPPKTDVGEKRLWEALQDLRDLRPAYVSVTYGAGGSTRSKTVELTSRIKRELSIETMAHLTCVGATREEIGEVLGELKEGGVENIIALRGDPPKGQERFEVTSGGFAYASELTGFVREGHDFCLAGACYPESHPEAPSAYQDLHNLKLKVDAGVQFLITQLFFDNRFYFDFVDRARAVGINIPIIPGIMPIQNVEQIKRFTSMCGASIPEPLMKALEKRADQPERVHELGVAHATIQCLGLLQGGAPGIHFYTLNKSTATREILTAIRTSARI